MIIHNLEINILQGILVKYKVYVSKQQGVKSKAIKQDLYETCIFYIKIYWQCWFFFEFWLDSFNYPKIPAKHGIFMIKGMKERKWDHEQYQGQPLWWSFDISLKYWLVNSKANPGKDIL